MAACLGYMYYFQKNFFWSANCDTAYIRVHDARATYDFACVKHNRGCLGPAQHALGGK